MNVHSLILFNTQKLLLVPLRISLELC